MNSTDSLRKWSGLFASVILLNLLWVVFSLLAVVPWGTDFPLVVFSTIAPFLILAALVGVVLSMAGGGAQLERVGLPCAVFLVTGLLSAWAGHEVFEWGLRRQVGRGDAIVAAVRQYEADRGALPSELAEVVPQYLKELPRSVLPGRSFQEAYEIDPKTREWSFFFPISRTLMDFSFLRFDSRGVTGGPSTRTIGEWVFFKD
jgi:hypothetical protein